MIKAHKLIKKIIFPLIIIVCPLPFITLASYIPNLSIIVSNPLYVYMGIAAYIWMLIAIYLATKPKWLDKILGLPDIYFVHVMITVLSVIIAYIHKWNLASAGIVKQLGDLGLYIYLGIIVYSLVFMAGWLTSRIHILNKIKKFLEKIFKRKLSIWIHRLNLVATILIYLHIWNIKYISSFTPFMVSITFVSIYVSIAYINFLIYKKGDRATVRSINMIDKNIIELEVELSSKTFVRAGDFIYITIKDEDSHPFSILRVDGRLIKLGIDMVGDFTKSLINLKVGQKVYITDGYGILYNLLDTHDKEIIFFAGGIGVVPMISLVEKFSEKNITFFYSVKRDKGFIKEDLLNELNKNENINIYLKKSRFLEDELKNLLPINKDALYIIAGPMKMNIYYEKYLKGKGIKSDQIYYESFNL